MRKYTVRITPMHDQEREVEVTAKDSGDAILVAEKENPGYYAGDVYDAREKRRILYPCNSCGDPD